MLDKEVVDAGGFKMGKAKDLVFDESGWRVNAIDVELESSVADEFNMKRHFHKTRLPIDVRHFQAISGDRVLLKTTNEDLFNLVAAPMSNPPPATTNLGEPKAQAPPQGPQTPASA